MIKLKNLVRKNILSLKPYSSARDEFGGSSEILLDANENPFGDLNRYPDPYQRTLKERIGELKAMSTENIFIGNGSDEVIDLAFRIFCNPGKEKALTFSPSYGMYEVSANINDVELVKIPLNNDFQSDISKLTPYLNDILIKLIIICSPNNPTGNSLDRSLINQILSSFNGIVLVDEAYIDFSEEESWNKSLNKYPNLIVCQTLSKAWGLAAVRIGIAYAGEEIIRFFNKVKPPYNISDPNQKEALKALEKIIEFKKNKQIILEEKKKLIHTLKKFRLIKKVYPSDANFLLVEVKDANRLYNSLVNQNIIVRNRSSVVENCIRITVGSPDENIQLVNAMKKIEL